MLIYIIICIFIIAILYSTVGHGGASGYIAILALFAYSQNWIRQDALILNLLVSGIAFVQYFRSGHFQWKLFASLVIWSFPMAYLGGIFELETAWYDRILGVMLLIPAAVFLLPFQGKVKPIRKLPIVAAMLIGSALGFISGLTGIGGGVLLSPILIFGSWADQKHTAAISAPFIFVNSAAGLLGIFQAGAALDGNIIYFCVAAVIGGAIGATMGAQKFNNVILKKILGLVLLIASLKLLLA